MGHFKICELISEIVKEKNPSTPHNGWTPLHFADQNGQLKICELIRSKVKNKNPEDLNGQTPHSLAIQHVNKLFKIISDPAEPEDVPGGQRRTRKRATKVC